MGTKTVDQLTVITTLNSTDKFGVWKDSSDEYCGIAYSDLLTNVNIASYLKLDGSTPMTGALAMGTHAISGVTTLAMAGALSGVTTLAMGGALSGVTTISMSSTITGVTGITMSGTLAMNTNAISGITTLNGISISTGFVLADGSVVLTADWDIGSGRKIKADQIAARSSSGLKLYESGGKGMFVINSTGYVGFNQSTPISPIHLTDSSSGGTQIRFENTDTGGRTYVMLSTGSVSTGGAGKYQIVEGTSGNRLTYDGPNDRLGIGTNSPSTPLHVFNATTSQVTIDSTFATGVSILTFNGGYDIWRPANVADLIIGSYPSNKFLTITAVGKVGINTQSTTPDSIVHIMNASAGSVTATGTTALTVEGSGNTALSFLTPAANTAFIYFGSPTLATQASIGYDHSVDSLTFRAANSSYCRVSSANVSFEPVSDNTIKLGASGQRWSQLWAGTTTINTSDEREKINIKSSPLGLDFILKLNPISWIWPNDERPAKYETQTDENGNKREVLVWPAVSIKHERPHYGFTSQQVKETMDEVGIDFGGYVYDPDTDVYGLRYDEFIAPIVRAIQEQQSLINQLTQTVSELLSKVQALQGV